jgi:hypothetical protein
VALALVANRDAETLGRKSAAVAAVRRKFCIFKIGLYAIEMIYKSKFYSQKLTSSTLISIYCNP